MTVAIYSILWTFSEMHLKSDNKLSSEIVFNMHHLTTPFDLIVILLKAKNWKPPNTLNNVLPSNYSYSLSQFLGSKQKKRLLPMLNKLLLVVAVTLSFRLKLELGWPFQTVPMEASGDAFRCRPWTSQRTVKCHQPGNKAVSSHHSPKPGKSVPWS